MDKELEKTLKYMSKYSKKDGRRGTVHVYTDKVFIEDNVIYATDGKIMITSENTSGIKDFAIYRDAKLHNSEDSLTRQTWTEIERLYCGQKISVFRKLMLKYAENKNTLSFDIDFSDSILPVVLQCSNARRYDSYDRARIDFTTSEVVFTFDGGKDEDGGVTAFYGDVIKNVKGTEEDILLNAYFLIEILKVTKEHKAHFEYCSDNRNLTVTSGKYTFYWMPCNS